MKTIPLTQGKFALVDNEDFIGLSQHKWRARQKHGIWYARRNAPRVNGKQVVISMHRQILDAPPGMEVDHKNGDGLNNRRSNLRLATHRDNMRNSKKRKDNASGFKGVSWNQECQKWVACIYINGIQKYLGRFTSVADAHAVYKAASEKNFGEFARLE